MKNIVSVVTICFNSESEIENTLKSVLEQDYKFMEYVIKDGNSVDKTNEIIKKYQSKFQSKGIGFKHIISKDKGIYDAMNIAVENCNGDWVIFMNSGDKFYNNTVLSDVFEYKNWYADIVYGHTLFQLLDNRGMIVNHNADFLEEGWSLCHQSLFVKKELLGKFPFDCKYRIVADYDQIYKLKKEGCVFHKVNTIISNVNREGLSNRFISLRNKEDNQLKEKYNLKFKKRSIFMGTIKQFIRGIVPVLEMLFFIKSHIKKTIQFELYDR